MTLVRIWAENEVVEVLMLVDPNEGTQEQWHTIAYEALELSGMKAMKHEIISTDPNLPLDLNRPYVG